MFNKAECANQYINSLYFRYCLHIWSIHTFDYLNTDNNYHYIDTTISKYFLID